ncbi:molybdenum cofactor biosynthesis protein [Paenibacillus daejeonensis]|uniref:molybdenum cofactor biosynthesis protein n=1 Tax=Paenibacillus daejeonensis TaxID=135193 RepID=UPI0003701789|nr:molybdenum cofactor biosynthesis protein MoaE [Paenibacillus daejeonensis]
MSYTFTIQLFAGLSERFGQTFLQLIADHAELTVHELKLKLAEHYPEQQSALRASFLARNHAYAADSDTVHHQDELALLPPVSGGEDTELGDDYLHESDGPYLISSLPLSPQQTEESIIVPEHGAALSFIGTTREWTAGQRTVLLEYQAYVPMALKSMRQIGDEISDRWPGTRCAIAHRIGSVPVGEISVVIAVSAPHRDTCYEASRYAIERLKQIVPIWKKEIWEDGSEWKGHQQGPWNPLSEQK